MKVLSLVLVVAFSAIASANNLPFTKCEGTQLGDRSSVAGEGRKIVLSVNNTEQAVLIERTLFDGETAAYSTDFQMKKSYQVGPRYMYELVGMVSFAGGGSLLATLGLVAKINAGTWSETFSTFNEATGENVKETYNFRVTCTK